VENRIPVEKPRRALVVTKRRDIRRGELVEEKNKKEGNIHIKDT
jgi:hypothetical protein